MSYVDGFVIPLPVDKVDDYRKMAQKAGEVWMEYGALSFIENVADDMAPEGIERTFPVMAGVKDDETVVFSFIVFKSREHRDEVNAKVMADPRIKEDCPEQNPDANMPFDFKRMAYGGFKSIVELNS
ncbi:MAG: DUF1428 domain-containing protein [Vampirovibrionales bacterium]|nr:DUF1428 domain-containing protein [Vampirovibrionales bacterium]